MSSQLDRAAQYKNAVFELKVRAREDDNYQKQCVGCKEKIFFVEGEHAVTHGHIYSRAGMSEWSISLLCEYCFDKIMKEPEEVEPEEVNNGLDFGPTTDPFDC